MAADKGFRSIPKVQGSPSDVRAIIENLRVLLGESGSGNKRALLREDLVSFADTLGFNFNPRTGALTPSTGGSSDLATPQIPIGFAANGAFTNIILSWDPPTFVGFAYAEIYRSTIDDYATAVRIGTTLSAVYADPVGYAQDYYYWIRFVNTEGTQGPINATAGTLASTAPNISTVMAALSDEIDISLLSTSLRDQSIFLDSQWGVKSIVGDLVGGVGFVNDGFTTQFFVNAETFAVLAPDDSHINPFFIIGGVTYIDETLIRAASIQVAQIETLTVDDITGFNAAFVLATIGTGSITNAYIGNVIESDNYVTGVSGWHIDKSGFAEFPTLFADFIQVTDIAVVSTLMIQGQAVTIPTSSFTAAYVAIGSNTIAGQLQSVTFTSSGNPVHIVFTGSAHATLSNHFLRLEVRRVINGGSAVVIRNAVSLFGSQIFQNSEEEISLAFNDSAAVNGDVVTYSVWGYRGGATAPGMSVGNRAMLSVEHKQTGV